jgi:hypothetical protein
MIENVTASTASLEGNVSDVTGHTMAVHVHSKWKCKNVMMKMVRRNGNG